MNKKSTIKLGNETKQELIDLSFSKKGMSFEQIILELIREHYKTKKGAGK